MDQHGQRIVTAVDNLDMRLICDPCGDLTLPAVADLDARGRRHALTNPGHEVRRQWKSVKHFFVKSAPSASTGSTHESR